jgi:hypothetical protein
VLLFLAAGDGGGGGGAGAGAGGFQFPASCSSPQLLEEVAATSTKLGTVRYTRGRARAAPAAL